MICFTYDNGILTQGYQLAGKTQKTCAFNLKIPADWDADEFERALRAQVFCDTLLHCVANICEGDSVNSVFPSGCIALISLDTIHIDNINNSCTIVSADAEKTVYVLFDGSCLWDDSHKQYIYNSSGELNISKDIPSCAESSQAADFEDTEDFKDCEILL